jgi:hypothetical protein
MKAYEILPAGMTGSAMKGGGDVKEPKPYEILPGAGVAEQGLGGKGRACGGGAKAGEFGCSCSASGRSGTPLPGSNGGMEWDPIPGARLDVNRLLAHIDARDISRVDCQWLLSEVEPLVMQGHPLREAVSLAWLDPMRALDSVLLTQGANIPPPIRVSAEQLRKLLRDFDSGGGPAMSSGLSGCQALSQAVSSGQAFLDGASFFDPALDTIRDLAERCMGLAPGGRRTDPCAGVHAAANADGRYLRAFLDCSNLDAMGLFDGRPGADPSECLNQVREYARQNGGALGVALVDLARDLGDARALLRNCANPSGPAGPTESLKRMNQQEDCGSQVMGLFKVGLALLIVGIVLAYFAPIAAYYRAQHA